MVKHDETQFPGRHWLLLTLALFLLALGMRLYRLADLPPGLFHDEAYNTLDAQALLEGLPHPRFYDSWEVYPRSIHSTWPPAPTRWPVFLEGNYGREALFHYLGAVSIALFGPQVWSLRLVSALLGALIVPIAFWVTRELFPGQPARLAILSAAVVTGTYSLLTFSRMGLRIIALVTLQGLTVALWWRAARDGRRRWWALAGLLLGLAQYTYIPARVLPPLVVLPALVWIKRQPQQRKQIAQNVLAALLITLLVTAPLILFFARYPDYLTLRANAIAFDAPERGPAVMVANVGRVLGGLLWQGDPNPILNLPGRPALDAVQAVFFVLGLVVCLRRLRQTAHAFLLLWTAFMLTPSIASGIAPTFGRSIGSTLPAAIITAVGLQTAWTTLNARWPQRRALATSLVVGLLGFSIGLTAHDYFNVWAQTPGLAQTFHEDMAVIGRYIGAQSAETVVYMTPSQKYYATLLLALGDRERPGDFFGPAGLLPAGDPARPAVYLLLEDDPATGERLETTFPGGYWNNPQADFRAYHVPLAADRAQPQHSTPANLAGLIQLIGFDLASTQAHPGDLLSVQMTWQALDKIERRNTAFVHLLGPPNPASSGSPLWAQDDHEPGQATYTTDRWFPGEVVIDTFQLEIPADAPAGEYTLSSGFYDSETLQRLPRHDAQGDTQTLTTLTLVEPTP